ncbi:POK18 protein, partial [Rhinoptilus africanus]|nr:POK18 protein [Rhinoptilus africanus]
MVIPQPIQLQVEVKTLNDVQKLVGMINWIRPYVGIPPPKLQPLFELLRGGTDISAP